MPKIAIILLLLILLGCSQPQIPIILTEEYNFLSTDGGITRFKQNSDTLYEYDCFVNRPSYSQPRAHFEIIGVSKSEDFTILKLKYLDKIPLEDNFCPGKQFALRILKNVNKDQFELLPPFSCYTQEQIDTIQITRLPLNKMSRFSFFSDTYLKKLSAFKNASTKDELEEIIDAIEGNNFKSGRISYSAEELNKACIKKGFNPMGVGLKLDSLFKMGISH